MEKQINAKSNFLRQIIFVIGGGAIGGIVIFCFLEWLATNSIAKRKY